MTGRALMFPLALLVGCTVPELDLAEYRIPSADVGSGANLSCNHGVPSDDGLRCECDEGWIDSADAACDACASGYHRGDGGACVKDVRCGEHGTPLEPADDCACDEGWEDGDDGQCSRCAQGYHLVEDEADRFCVLDLECGAHGSLNPAGDDCVCEAGWQDGPLAECSECAESYHDEDGRCAADPECGLNGSLNVGRNDCVCVAGWADAELGECTTCAEGFHAEDDTCVADADCGDHGQRTVDSLDCQCDAGYIDGQLGECTACAAGYEREAGACLDVCNGNGRWSADDERCACDVGWRDLLTEQCAQCAPGWGPEELCNGCAQGFHIDPDLNDCVANPDCGPFGEWSDDLLDCACQPGSEDDEVAECARCIVSENTPAFGRQGCWQVVEPLSDEFDEDFLAACRWDARRVDQWTLGDVGLDRRGVSCSAPNDALVPLPGCWLDGGAHFSPGHGFDVRLRIPGGQCLSPDDSTGLRFGPNADNFVEVSLACGKIRGEWYVDGVRQPPLLQDDWFGAVCGGWYRIIGVWQPGIDEFDADSLELSILRWTDDGYEDPIERSIDLPFNGVPEGPLRLLGHAGCGEGADPSAFEWVRVYSACNN